MALLTRGPVPGRPHTSRDPASGPLQVRRTSVLIRSPAIRDATEEHPGVRVGVYIDIENITRNGGKGLRFDVLRRYSCRQGGVPIRLNAYLPFDDERAGEDAVYREGVDNFENALRDAGFKVFRKPIQWFTGENGGRAGKASTDLDMAVDMLLQSERLERVVLVSGDVDFVRVVRALQNKGCRVEVVAFQNVSASLRREADYFVSGFLIPGLLPDPRNRDAQVDWGEETSRVRGVCYHYNADKGFGFVRYLQTAEGDLTISDTREHDSPYDSAFFHVTDLPEFVPAEDLPSRDLVLAFTLREGREPGELVASDIALAHRY